MSGYLRKLDPRNKYDCTVYTGHDCMRPQKLNCENIEDCLSVKIGPQKISLYTVLSILLYIAPTSYIDLKWGHLDQGTSICPKAVHSTHWLQAESYFKVLSSPQTHHNFSHHCHCTQRRECDLEFETDCSLLIHLLCSYLHLALSVEWPPMYVCIK
jgi:hypothetical protein